MLADSSRDGAPNKDLFQDRVDSRGHSRSEAAKPWLIALAASAGGIHALKTILPALDPDLPAAVVVIQHRPADRDGLLIEILRRSSQLPVREATQGMRVEPGHVYIARPDSHLTVTADRHFLYRDGTRIQSVRSSANPLMRSSSHVFAGHVIAVVLTGGGADAADGVQHVKAHGGIVIAQDEATSEQWGMPQSAILTGTVDHVLPLTAIAPAINDLVNGRTVCAGMSGR